MNNETQVEVPLRVRKMYDGKLKEGEFTFELTGVEVETGNTIAARNAEQQMKSAANGQLQEKDDETGEQQRDLDKEQKPSGTGEIVSPEDETQSEAGMKPEDETKPGTETDSKDETQPGAGTDSDEGTQPGTEADSKDETKPETGTKPEDGTQSGTGTDAEDETRPESGTKPEDETKPGAGTDPKDETQPETGTDPGDATQPEMGTDSEDETQPETGTKPEKETQSGVETRSDTETQSGTGQQGTAGPVVLRQGQKFARSIMLSAESLIFRITALKREGQTASAMAWGSRQTAIPVWTSGEWRTAVPFRILGEQRITVPTAASEEQRDSAASASQEEQQPPSTSAPKEEQQPPATSAPKEDENRAGTGQEETSGDKEKEETGNNPGDMQTEETEGIPETGSDSQGQGETDSSPEDELPSGRHETEGTQKPESQPTDGTDTSPEDELPADRQETQGSAAEGNTESVAEGNKESAAEGNTESVAEGNKESLVEKKAGSEEKEERLGEVSDMLGDELMLIANMPGPSNAVGEDPDDEENPTWRQSNGEDGWVDFGTLKFEQLGTYTYELREIEGEKSHIVYSSDIYRIIIKIAKDGDLLKVASVSYKRKQNGAGDWQDWNGEILTFVNELKTGRLKVEKTVTGSGGDKEKVFNFAVVFDFSGTEEPKEVTISKNGKPADGLELEDNSLEFTLKDTEYVEVEGLPVGTTYTVTETDANQDGYTTTVTQGEVSASEYAAAASKAKAGAGEIDAVPEETESGADEAVTIPAEFEAGGDEVITIPAENEVSVLSADETAIGEATGKIEDGKKAQVTFVNDRSIGNLTVAKTVTGTGGDTEKEWNFRVELGDRTINGQYGDMFFTNGVAEFTLKSGQSATAEDLPSGLTYTVTEKEANQDGYETLLSGESGTISDGATAEAKFVNRKEPPPPDEHKGNLTVAKTVTGTGGDTEKEWNFRVELGDRTINGQYGDMFFTDGAAEFTLKSGQSAAARNLPPGITYTVTEAEANQDGYGTSASGASGTIPDGDTAKSSFVNRKDTPPPDNPPDSPGNPPDNPGNPSGGPGNPPDSPGNPPDSPGSPPGSPIGPQDTPLWYENPQDTPQTGDNSHFGLWLSLMIFSLIGAAALSIPAFGKGRTGRRRRRK